MAIETVPTKIRALLHTGDLLVEVEGTLSRPRRTRFSDVLSAPDLMQELTEATVTRHLPKGLQQEMAPMVTVNRDRILLATEQAAPGPEPADSLPGMRIQLDAHVVKLLCPGFEITGTMHVPLGGSPYYLATTGAGRFIGVTDAQVTSSTGDPLPMFQGRLPFCLVNRAHVQVVLGAAARAAADAPAAEVPAS
jgi:hypothetical protein